MPDSVSGTLAWMAPELLSGQSRHNAKSDVYALGMTLYEIAFGVRPFEHFSCSEISAMIINGLRPTIDLNDYNEEAQPKFYPGTAPPSSLITLISECWDADRDKRPNIEDVVSRLQAIRCDERAARGMMLKVLRRDLNQQSQHEHSQSSTVSSSISFTSVITTDTPINRPAAPLQLYQHKDVKTGPVHSVQTVPEQSAAPAPPQQKVWSPLPAGCKLDRRHMSQPVSTHRADKADNQKVPERYSMVMSQPIATVKPMLAERDALDLPQRTPPPSDEADELFQVGLAMLETLPHGSSPQSAFETISDAAKLGHPGAICKMA